MNLSLLKYVSALEREGKDYSSVGLFFATIVLVPFQVLLFATVIVENLFPLQSSVMILFPDNRLILAAYILMPIIYCTIASLLFHPKRIVSPLNVQIGTIVVFMSIMIYNALSAVPMPNASTFIGNLIGSLLFVSVISIAVGLIQLKFVRWVIGLNLDSMDRATFLINGKPKDMLKILGDDFLSGSGLSRRKDDPKAQKPIWILKWSDTYGNLVIFAISSQTDHDDKSILATIAFKTGQYGVSKSKRASDRRDSIINDIAARLMKSDPTLSITPVDRLDDPVSLVAQDHALVPTLSKIEITEKFFRRIPRYHLYIIAILLVALATIAVAYAMNLLDLGAFVGIVIVIVLGLLLDLGSSIREELSRKTIEELD
jgi:hypothetical protein